ncbi:helix-turn-helix transcriptional regulator [Mycolicibacterium sp. BiH015]|uniref:helix-turn-helix domain-containing protein n=1 Tax=Mycolicibacterium sp. BiH015 TaxID=3018808 RepID=UPI0022DEC3DC|nr:helix-turn-helix transcriptional regulator [Mycolicibacterium sp. BiH015]MDA2893431.1 helix-turn-helix transcriptional regulator [Mycolicibacterium sp. BiH015]
MPDDAPAPGTVRAGAAFAARRDELGISQRELARKGVITASSLIAFEKGRSWPRERTRAVLEEIVQWPAGTLAAIYHGADAPGASRRSHARDAEIPGIVDAVDVAMHTVATAMANLPAPDHPKFANYAEAILSDLRRLEAITARTIRTSHGSLAAITALAAIRRRYDDLMCRAAAGPAATLGQRLYAARRRAHLTAGETAAALGVSADLVVAVEHKSAASGDVRSRIEELIAALNSA